MSLPVVVRKRAWPKLPEIAARWPDGNSGLRNGFWICRFKYQAYLPHLQMSVSIYANKNFIILSV